MILPEKRGEGGWAVDATVEDPVARAKVGDTGARQWQYLPQPETQVLWPV